MKPYRAILGLLLVVFLVRSPIAAQAFPSTALPAIPLPPALDKVSAHVWAALDAQETAEVLVILAPQADLRAADEDAGYGTVSEKWFGSSRPMV